MSQSTAEGFTSTKAIRLTRSQKCDEPEAYLNLNECERKCKNLVESFRSELSPNLKDRLFLQPICTYIQPTLLPYPELYDMKSCAQFLARHMIYEPFVEGVGIVSPSQTLEWAVGDCVDFSFLLASLLIGAGYDAYVVYGRAPERIRLKCMSTKMIRVSACMDIEIRDECNAQNPSGGDGTHSWILVKAGSRNVKEHTFIEPSTGILYPLCHSPYSQVSFICNNDNCWVGESGSIQEVAKFVCSEKENWRPLLPANSVPSTWTNPITLSRETFLLRYSPGGKRSISLDKAKVELFGANADPQGVVCRVIEYEDTAQTVPVEITELFCPSRRTDSISSEQDILFRTLLMTTSPIPSRRKNR